MSFRYLVRGAERPEKVILFPLSGEREDEALLEAVYAGVSAASSVPFAIVGIFVPDWNRDLSPWPFQSGRWDFAGNGSALLSYIRDDLLPELDARFGAPSYCIGGYSLSGLFCLWAALETGLFDGCAACSASLWYPGFTEYASAKGPGALRTLYLSLGTKEEKARDPYMREVGNCTRALYEQFSGSSPELSVFLEWNPGNHFADVPARIVKGFVRLLAP